MPNSRASSAKAGLAARYRREQCRALRAFGVVPIGAGPGEGPVEIMVRPEQIRLLPPDVAGCAQGRVLGVTFYGHDAVAEIALAGAADTTILRAAVQPRFAGTG